MGHFGQNINEGNTSVHVCKMKIQGISNSFDDRVYNSNNNAANGTYRITMH